METTLSGRRRCHGEKFLLSEGDSTAIDVNHVGEFDAYVQDLTASQGRLRAYILASLGNHANTADVLQRTNLTLWKKAKEFQKGADFMPWALSIARYEVLAFIRDSQRDRLVFSDDVVSLMLDTAATVVADLDNRRNALQECLEKLPRRSRDLLWQRYDENLSIRRIACDGNRSEDSVKSLFLRVRKRLQECIERTIRLEAV